MFHLDNGVKSNTLDAIIRFSYDQRPGTVHDNVNPSFGLKIFRDNRHSADSVVSFDFAGTPTKNLFGVVMSNNVKNFCNRFQTKKKNSVIYDKNKTGEWEAFEYLVKGGCPAYNTTFSSKYTDKCQDCAFWPKTEEEFYKAQNRLNKVNKGQSLIEKCDGLWEWIDSSGNIIKNFIARSRTELCEDQNPPLTESQCNTYGCCSWTNGKCIGNTLTSGRKEPSHVCDDEGINLCTDPTEGQVCANR